MNGEIHDGTIKSIQILAALPRMINFLKKWTPKKLVFFKTGTMITSNLFLLQTSSTRRSFYERLGGTYPLLYGCTKPLKSRTGIT